MNHGSEEFRRGRSDESQLIERAILPEAMAPVPDCRFAAAIAGFGQLLHGSAYLGSWSWYDAIALASSGCGPDPFGYRAEAVQLMRLAANLSVAAQYPVEPFLDGHVAWHS